MTDRRALALLAVLHLAIVAAVQPRGDFPLNDDWAYAHSVRWFLDEGRIRLSDWVGMNLLPQTLAGSAAAALFGFSFETLRHVTQLVALLAMGGAYFWFRVVRLEPLHAFAATAALVAFPAWPVLANSYMTDLYGLALGLPAAAFFLKALEGPSRGAVVAATILSILGVLERQVALAIPFAFMVACLWARRPIDGRSIAYAVVPFALVAAAALAYHAYLAWGPGVPEGQRVAHGRVIPMALKALRNEEGLARWALSNAMTMGGYLGLFTVGWLAWWGMKGASRGQKLAVFAIGIAIGALAFAFAWFPPYRPGQVIDAAGIGPFLLYDAVRETAPLDRSPGMFWRGLALPAAFASAALVVAMVIAIARVARREAAAPFVFIVALIAAYLGPFVVTDYFDRYLLFVLPFVFALWASLWPRGDSASGRRVLAGAWIVAAIGFSAAATHDYFAWNRARWEAIRTAERSGVGADLMDGGYEYNADRRFLDSRPPAVEGKSWWWVVDDRHVVAFSAVPGYEVVQTWTVARWLPRSPAEIRLLRRKP